MNDGAKITFGAGLQKTTVTLPIEQLCHYITDAELEQASEIQQGSVANICLTSIGASIGSITPAFDAISRFGDTVRPMTKTDMVSFSVFLISLSITVMSGILWKGRHNSRVRLITTIRGRTKVSVHIDEKD